MSGVKKTCNTWNSAVVLPFLFGMIWSSSLAAETQMTAGVVLSEMPVRERTSYIMGIIEGLAYARFRTDSAASGRNDETGMGCIYDWFYADSMERLDQIEQVFQEHQDHYPSVLLAVMIKQECGE